MSIFAETGMKEGLRSRLKEWRQRLSFAKPFLEGLFSVEARIAERWCASAYRRLCLAQWGLLPLPEFFEHKIGVFWSWTASRRPHFVERGAFNLLVMNQGCRVLELCCGDGFNAHHFYSIRAASVLSVDFDPKAINYARRNFKAPNVSYEIADIRTQMPAGTFDNVIWDTAIEHFTESEIAAIMANIKRRLTSDGVLSGHTIVEQPDGKKMLVHHEYEFKSKEDLARFFTPHFKNVRVFETIYPERHNLYFWASDADLPFAPGWQHST